MIDEVWFPIGVIFMLVALTIALIKPYQKACMSYVDSLLLSNLALCCFVATSSVFTLNFLTSCKNTLCPPNIDTHSINNSFTIRKAQLSAMFNRLSQCCCKLKEVQLQYQRSNSALEFSVDAMEEGLPTINPASTKEVDVNKYGTMRTY